MATFYTDADRVGAGEFVEAQVSLATEFTLPAGQITRFRWPFPAVAPSVAPAIRLYNAAGALVASVSFDTAVLSAWNWATPGPPISVAAGTYRATVTTTRYPARSGFFSGGPITRGDITAVQGRFAAGDAVPGSTSTASYLVDVDFTASAAGSSVAPAGVAVPVALGAAAVAWSGAAAADGLSVSVALGAPTLGWSGSAAPDGLPVDVAVGSPVVGAVPVAPDGLTVPVAVGAPSLVWSGSVSPDGLAVPVAVGVPRAHLPGQGVRRPTASPVSRPTVGPVTRPTAAAVTRPIL